MIDGLLAVIAPHECVGCGLEGRLICGPCYASLPKIPPRCYRCRRLSANSLTCQACRRASKLYSVRAVTYHGGLARQLVWRLKFDGARASAGEMARLMAPFLASEDPRMPVLITHVPTATSRVRRRSYDQAKLLAKTLAKQVNLPCSLALQRLGQHQQVGATRRERTSHLKDAFRVVKPEQLSGARIILIDDVLTTGATLEEAAAALKAAGAKRVEGLVFTQA